MLIEKIKTDKKISIFFLIIVITSYTIIIFPNMLGHDEHPDYYLWMKPYLDNCQLNHLPQYQNGTNTIIENLRSPVKWWIDCASDKMGHDNLLPSIFSLMIIPMVYLIGFELSRDRLVSMIAVIVFIINPLFSDWSTSGVYDQSWAFLFLLSVYLITKIPQVSPFIFVLSLATKGLVLCYLPMWLYRVMKSNKSENTKAWLIGSTISLTALGLFLLYLINHNLVGASIGFYPDHLWDGFTRTLGILSLSIPLLLAVFGLEISFKKYCKSIPGRKETLIWIIGMILTTPIIYLFSNQFMFPYRFVPFDAFFSIYIGIVLTKVTYSFANLKRKTHA